MIDPTLLAEQPDAVTASLRKRHAGADTFAAVERFGVLHALRRTLIQEGDTLRAERNKLSREIGQLMRENRGSEADEAKARVAEGNERTRQLDEELAMVQAEQDQLAKTLPNLLHPSVPDGETEADNPVIKTWGTPRTFPGAALSHVEIGARLGIVDLERSIRLSGARFAVLSGLGAKLERGLINFFLDLHTNEHGYTEVMVPYIVQRHVAEGTGQLPKFEADMFKLAEPLNGSDAFLIPTAELPVTNLYRDEILDEAQLPMKFAAFTPCFRSEAGSAGRDVRGLIRQHQFHKVELVWLTHPDRVDQDYKALLQHAETALQRLELPYRMVRHCGGEVSFSAARCHDFEVWLPSQEKYREISSCSHFTDFQARRMSLRYRPESADAKKQRPKLCHTLNGSGLAVGRTMVALLENGQQPDGSVVLPKVLHDYVGTDVIRAK